MSSRYANALWAPKKAHYQSICTFAVINLERKKTQNDMHSKKRKINLYFIQSGNAISTEAGIIISLKNFNDMIFNGGVQGSKFCASVLITSNHLDFTCKPFGTIHFSANSNNPWTNKANTAEGIAPCKIKPISSKRIPVKIGCP